MFGPSAMDELNQINQTADWIIVWQSVLKMIWEKSSWNSEFSDHIKYNYRFPFKKNTTDDLYKDSCSVREWSEAMPMIYIFFILLNLRTLKIEAHNK